MPACLLIPPAWRGRVACSADAPLPLTVLAWAMAQLSQAWRTGAQGPLCRLLRMPLQTMVLPLQGMASTTACGGGTLRRSTMMFRLAGKATCGRLADKSGRIHRRLGAAGRGGWLGGRARLPRPVGAGALPPSLPAQ